MDITQVIYEEDFEVNYKTQIGWFKAIRSNQGWYLYFGQEYLGTFLDTDKCKEHVENLKTSTDSI